MKKLFFIPALLSIAILFGACGGDKKPGDLPGEITASAEKTFPALVASEGVAQTLEVEFKLTDFPNVSKYKNWLKQADVPTSPSTFIELKGIAEADEIELKNVSISLVSTPGRQFPLTSATITDNVKYEADRLNRVEFFQAIIDEVRTKGSSKVALKYTPGTTMVNPDVKVTIKINAEFFFN